MIVLHFLGKWFARLFGIRAWKENPYVPIPREPFSPMPAPAGPDSTATAPRKKRVRSEVPQTLAELLEDMSIVFDALKLPDERASFLERRESRGLRKLGVHIPSPWVFVNHENIDDVRIDVSKVLPTMMCIGFPVKDKGKGYLYKKIAFGLKLGKFPARVSRRSGVPYVFGAAFTSPDRGLSGNLFWAHCFVAIHAKTGEIQMCDELSEKSYTIPVKNPSDRKIYGRMRTVQNKGWNHSFFLRNHVDLATDKDLPYEYMRDEQKRMVWNIIEYWRNRPKRWEVCVTKGKDRVTFGIEYENTKRYFANRDKTVKAADGKAKRIIHHVNEHSRTYQSGKTVTVKEHIRGICEFDWNEYHCAVTAPTFNGMLFSAEFGLPPLVIPDDEDDPKGMWTLDKVGALLSDLDAPRKAA